MKTLIAIFLLSGTLVAETPEWMINHGRSEKYPGAKYLTGYGFARIEKNNGRDAAEIHAGEYARKNLIEKVQVHINSVTIQHTEEAGDTYSSMYSSATQSTSALDMQGLETEKYYDTADGIIYAFVYAEREPIAVLYREKIKKLQQEIADKLIDAEALEQEGKTAKALDSYTMCLLLSRQLEEAQTICTFVQRAGTAADLQLTANANENTLSRIRRSISRLVQRPLKTVDDVAWYLAYLLKEQLNRHPDKPLLTIMAAGLYYQDTKMGSSFSRFFTQILENKLVEGGRCTVIRQGATDLPLSSDPARGNAKAAGASYVLSGSYWEQGTSVKFIVNVRSAAEGRIVASAEAMVDAAAVASAGKSLKPENYQQALIDQKIFASGEIAGGGLTLEAWTNRGVDNVMFTENDTLTVALRVNCACYIRFIYHMANGKRVLLLDNYFMDQSKVNTAYHIPDAFVCAAPFGGETLQIFARTEKYDDLAIEMIDGYNYLNDDLRKIVAGTRGFKKAAPRSMQTEQRIQITTMKE